MASEPSRQGKCGMRELADELFLRTNLYPCSTGLPMVIWVGPRYEAQHDLRIKVMQSHGPRMDPGSASEAGPENLAVLGVRPQPASSPASCRRPICGRSVNWIASNETAIMDLWNELIDGAELIQRLRPLSPSIPA